MKPDPLKVEIYETSATGNKLKRMNDFKSSKNLSEITLKPEEKFQTITGFGGSFTESSAYLLNQVSQANREKILQAYFGNEGARYSLTRTHINSCDFSLGNYSYAPEPGDTELNSFSIREDMDDIVPMIKDALAISADGFKIISSPWTAPPWMKDNNSYVGGKLLPEYYDSWALFFSKYIQAYREQGIEIWGVTVENEPLGNNNNWESMHFTAREMADFVKNHLEPRLRSDGHPTKILAYDQNRDELEHWADVVYGKPEYADVFDGFAIHWYASTYDWFPEALQYAHSKAPKKHLIQTEACVDAEVPKWKEDNWYWSKEATDWGWDWAPEDQKHMHPKYVPVFRYARDIIGCLNNYVDGWVDWNMVLDRRGGPNWIENWCVAPVIVDTEQDEVYFTPLYYTMAHFSKFIRPGAKRIGFSHTDDSLMVTAAENPDGSVAVVILNYMENQKTYSLRLGARATDIMIQGKALQTIWIPPTQIVNHD